ncbi:asparagine synthase (glutamine-hydrolyzing) [Thermococcus sp.]|uniref:asparagine synthase (glutamine-hydrolyzing) n=1 Tax=Thermococcus sp. TaxID=35749 RepID=UPI0026132749|nr:asparagine synthase (glutamine-hydrolyzing) [Thermococcus sp.]
MCLIAGGIGENLREKFIGMIEAGKHRGPDGFGVWTDSGVLKSSDFSRIEEVPEGKIGILQCRLAMTGSKSFIQPFVNELALVHNGEVYNHRAIREYLEGKGVSFESDVDSEVILRLLEFLSREASFPRAVRELMSWLEGDYAVAFSDGGRLYLFRDPIGVRPLYFSPRGFFASEKKVLWAIGERAVPVEPGEIVALDGHSVRRARLFSPERLKGRGLSEGSVLRGLEKLLDYSVRVRTTRKTGVLFSGGLDSTIVAFLASRHSDVVLYTAGTEGSHDVEWAGRVADHLGLPLRVETFDLELLREELPRIAFAIEEPNPMNLAIAVPLYFATRLAGNDGVKVILTGQGADELFGGYAKYLERPWLMWEDLLTLAERNLARDDKVAMLNGVEGRYPFLSLPVVRLALNVPPELKLSNGRKLILRKLARKLGLPEWIAERPKKAAQYGSGAQKLLEKLAKEKKLRLREFARELFEGALSKRFLIPSPTPPHENPDGGPLPPARGRRREARGQPRQAPEEEA